MNPEQGRPTERDYVFTMTSAGALLSLGAPLGYFVYSFIFMNPADLKFLSWCREVLTHQDRLLIYLTVPTILVFSTFGYVSGIREWALANKTNRMEEFVHVVAHDVRSPLTAVKGAIDVLREEIKGPLNTAQKEYVGMISRQSQVMYELTRELLDIHRMESGKDLLNLEDVDLAGLIGRAVEEMRLQAQLKLAEIRIVSDLEDGAWINVDAFRIRQVFRNILSNAIRFTPERGRIEIRMFRNRDGLAEVTIFNPGPSISADKLPVIFDKFVQSSIRDYKLSHGLGLAICKNIMDLHGGKIWAENVPAGVRFHMVFR